MNEQPILLAISTSRYSQHLVDVAMREADRLHASGAEVTIEVLYVLEQEDLARIGKKVGDAGFLGVSTTDELLDTLAAEHHRTALQRIDEVKAAAAPKGYPVTVCQVTGRFVESVLKQAEEKAYETILLTRADRPFVSRILFGSEADRVARMARKEGLGHVIIDEVDG